MVQIVMTMDTAVQEWIVIELQGALETRDEVSLEGRHIGDLHFDSMGIPQLIIGHHLLTGKIVNLDKPYAVMKRSTSIEPMEIEIDAGNSRKQTEYDIVALVKRKIVFKNRPKPIIIKTEPIRN
ncbi:chromosome transmission fidelity protein 8 homolog [Actinia tenebrosa]|uniref:Chromosome transmission fidelity protein 8 homolog n=1 Tax=Actinia tenebrosa TaxID=6105 RepID=A0A6P8IF33_ACTTE|nr:chromosome transmission fidelity protein 8 homolog [Actinia tenebrosa]